MPILEFHCPECDKVFEELIRDRSSRSSVSCPTCGSRKVSRQISVFSARSGETSTAAPSFGAGCGRCGDPNGPCGG